MSIRNIYSICIVTLLFPAYLISQEASEFTWINPVNEENIHFQGQGWAHEELKAPYDRLPSKAEESVRGAVWGLSRSTAGIYLTFSTDAPEIRVRYQTNSRYEMPHMPATGVSGLDLYVKNSSDEGLLWCRGKYSFKDTITYTYSNLNTRHPNPGKTYDYNLYLPLYNAVKWMEIGIPTSSSLSANPEDNQKPIVVYGTSIAQGGCASRPAMGWTSIVQRGLERPVINLAFSGNGRLEEEVVGLINEIDAAMFILDCLPNLTNEELYPDEELQKRISNTVNTLRKDHPQTPILLASHAGYSDDMVSEGSYSRVERVNRIQEQTFKMLKKEGVKHLYFLAKDDIKMCMDCTVDGTHQTDMGMQYYADAYLKKISKIVRK